MSGCTTDSGGRGCAVVRLLASHIGEPGSIHSGVAFRFSHVGIALDDAAGRRVLLGISPWDSWYLHLEPNSHILCPGPWTRPPVSPTLASPRCSIFTLFGCQDLDAAHISSLSLIQWQYRRWRICYTVVSSHSLLPWSNGVGPAWVRCRVISTRLLRQANWRLRESGRANTPYRDN
ncbi:hypothetical protein PR048_018667 [Dryococelus australis]|uniref:Uncharacterized protein n=1 Tax=Dryococelus australis TaxID=614101 RepID=A0ABQ9HD36_9NEOP|nr:hypothetical protein PR048_018667 [Dryococelus australis]